MKRTLVIAAAFMALVMVPIVAPAPAADTDTSDDAAESVLAISVAEAHTGHYCGHSSHSWTTSGGRWEWQERYLYAYTQNGVHMHMNQIRFKQKGERYWTFHSNPKRKGCGSH